jgi:AcrR family transcriptional regulator
MPKTPNEFKKIRQEKTKLIKQTALELFADNGYHNTSISQIAKKAKISKGLIYNYFDNKEHLLIEIVKNFIQRTNQYFDNNKKNITEKEFLTYTEKIFNEIKQNPKEWKLLAALYFQKDAGKILMKIEGSIPTKTYQILTDFFASKNCKNPTEEMMFYSSLMEGAAIQFIFMPEIFDIDTLKNKIIKFYKEKFNKNETQTANNNTNF